MIPPSTLIGNSFGQVAWVVQDIEAAEVFFREILCTPRFLKMENLQAHLSGKGYAISQRLTLPVARVAYFNTEAEIGVMTEIIGITEAGYQLIDQLKSGDY